MYWLVRRIYAHILIKSLPTLCTLGEETGVWRPSSRMAEDWSLSLYIFPNQLITSGGCEGGGGIFWIPIRAIIYHFQLKTFSLPRHSHWLVLCGRNLSEMCWLWLTELQCWQWIDGWEEISQTKVSSTAQMCWNAGMPSIFFPSSEGCAGVGVS